MGGGPGLLVHGKEGLHIAVFAVGQHCHEHIGRDDLAGVRIDNSGSITSPVHLHNLAGLVIQMHDGIDFCQVIRVILVEPQTVEPEDLTVIGHVDDLLADIYTAKCDAYLHFTAALNASGETAQPRRNGCSISAVEVRNPGRNTHGCEWTEYDIYEQSRKIIARWNNT